MSKLKTQEFENTKKRKSFLHGYTQYLTWANNNHAAVNTNEKQVGQNLWLFSHHGEFHNSYQHS